MKLWKGRFSKAANSSAEAFNASIETDQRLYQQDIQGSMAHALMLGWQEIIPMEEAEAIRLSLREILEDIENGKVEFTIEQEDIHMNIETLLTQRIGDAGKKLHTARSRNEGSDGSAYIKKRNSKVQPVAGLMTLGKPGGRA